MTHLVLSLCLILEPGAAGRPASSPASSEPPTVTWTEFFASVGTRGVVFSDRIKSLEGKRVRLQGYSLAREGWPDGIMLTRIRYVESDPHGPDAEFDVPFDTVGVVWRKGVRKSPVPDRPTVEGVLRLGNRTLGEQIVALSLDDAVPTTRPAP